MRALAGEPEVSTTLRYKKKMMLWTFPSPPAPNGAPAAQHPGVVGYSLMTFVIRNGLQALRQVRLGRLDKWLCCFFIICSICFYSSVRTALGPLRFALLLTLRAAWDSRFTISMGVLKARVGCVIAFVHLLLPRALPRTRPTWTTWRERAGSCRRHRQRRWGCCSGV